MNGRVLVVDDEPPIVRAVAANLRARGYQAQTAGNAAVALAAVELEQPDCIVLDLGLPDLHGLEVLRRLRSWTAVPVVVLTAAGSEHDKVRAFQLGADDYVTKPFSMVELMARVQVAIRHGQHARATPSPLIDAGQVRIDLDAQQVTRDGQPVRLTRIEYRLLEVLATNAGRLCSHRFLLEQVWGAGYEQESQYLRAHIANLRKKVDDPAAPHLILTEPGLGYRLVLPATGTAQRWQEG